MFKLLYLAILSAFYVLFIPLLLLLSFKQKYKHSIFQRFFPCNNKAFQERRVWFHVCSFGETKAIKPLLDVLEEKVHISVITQTGFNEAKKYSKSVRFLPFEIFLPFWMTQQKLLVVLEAELWYMLFLLAKKKETPTILLNARISDKSYKSYKKAKFLYTKIFKNIDYVYAQSELDKQRLEELGAKNVTVLGNIKLFADIKIEHRYTKPEAFITTAASTHEKEEEFIFRAWLEHKRGKLIVVPRHPERFKKVAQLLRNSAKEHNLTFNAFSVRKNFDSDITLVDAMGELNEIYAISDLVILGGSFMPKIGGHNFVEPATFHCKLITGEHFFNQKSIFPFIKNIEVATTQTDLAEKIANSHNLEKTEIVNKPDIEEIKAKVLKASRP